MTKKEKEVLKTHLFVENSKRPGVFDREFRSGILIRIWQGKQFPGDRPTKGWAWRMFSDGVTDDGKGRTLQSAINAALNRVRLMPGRHGVV